MSRRRGSAELGSARSRSWEHRIGNTIIYVVAEGEGTEFDYFRWLEATYGADLKFLIKMPPPAVRRNGLTPARIVERACGIADEPAIKQVWGVFDHDGRKDIDQVCSRQRPDRVKIALSHPSFELWLLLHFQDFPPIAQGGKSESITEELRTAHRAFADYKKGDKRIGAARFAALMEGGGIDDAVRRARAVSNHFSSETPSHRDPSTDVYLLIEALGIVSRPS